jgi:hypothetical protein
MPQSDKPGVRYSATTGDQVADVEHTSTAALSDGQLFLEIIDPEALTGDTYEVFFEEFQYITIDFITTVTIDSVDTLINISTGDTTFVVIDSTVTTVPDSMINTAVGWNVRNTTTGELVVENQFQAASNTELGRARPIIDGMEFVVTGPPLEFKRFEVVANAAGPVEPSEMGTFAFNDNGFPFLFNDLYPDGTDRPDGDRQQTNGSTWGVATGGTAGARAEWPTFISRTLRNDNADRAIPFDYEMRFTAGPNYGNWWFEDFITKEIPFELWNIGINTPDDPSDDYRMLPRILTNSGLGDITLDFDVWQVDPNDHAVSGGTNDPYTPWTYWADPVDKTPGQAGYDAAVAEGIGIPVGGLWDDASEVLARTVLVNWNGGDVTDPTFGIPGSGVPDAMVPEEGTIFRITSNKPNTTADKFTFTAPAPPSYSADVAKSDVDKINVYPNPYYGTNSEEIGRFGNFVTFNHLPADQEVTIRIFALNGVQVRKLEKHADASANESQFFRWDLLNETGLPVASGVYITYIDLPELGETKVLKVFIIQSAEILRFF